MQSSSTPPLPQGRKPRSNTPQDPPVAILRCLHLRIRATQKMVTTKSRNSPKSEKDLAGKPLLIPPTPFRHPLVSAVGECHRKFRDTQLNLPGSLGPLPPNSLPSLSFHHRPLLPATKSPSLVPENDACRSRILMAPRSKNQEDWIGPRGSKVSRTPCRWRRLRSIGNLGVLKLSPFPHSPPWSRRPMLWILSSSTSVLIPSSSLPVSSVSETYFSQRLTGSRCLPPTSRDDHGTAS